MRLRCAKIKKADDSAQYVLPYYLLIFKPNKIHDLVDF